MAPFTRRAVLCAAGTALVTGCSTSGDDGSGSNDETDTGALDLREANVVGVAYQTDDGAYNFDVTLHHDVHENGVLVSQPERSRSGDDDGEDGYADWWQVERLDGTRLVRRDLAHPHSSEPFTRSARVEVPADVTCVVVRGHDQTHGYGGVAMLVNLDTGKIREVRQGAEKRAFDAADCP
jgi:hypothetical protein